MTGDKMLYFTGDTHGSVDIRKLTSKNLRINGIDITSKDHLVICGDFGLPFYPYDVIKGSQTNGEYRFWTRFLADKKFTILFVDGNHDNHAFWKEQKVSEWHGGKIHIHPDIPNAYHLMRGEVYEDVDGMNIFSFGGAASHDVEPVYIGSECVRKGRTEGKTWWREETADESEIENALRNLDKYNNQVDCIVTHTPPFSVLKDFFPERVVETDRTAKFLDTVAEITEYGFWVCGHVHREYSVAKKKIIGLYNSIRSSEDIENILSGI